MEWGFLFAYWLSKPVWIWLAWLALAAAVLVVGLRHRQNRVAGQSAVRSAPSLRLREVRRWSHDADRPRTESTSVQPVEVR